MAPGSATTPRPGGRPTRCWRNASRWTRGTRQAWARLGRLQRVRAKYGDEAEDTTLAWARAESSLTRAAELNPDLSLAHGQLALLELDLGRTEDALTRLLTRAAIRPRDPNLFVGLVQVCRSAGLLEASVAAHHVARRLDPRIPTSVIHTFWMLGHYARALDAAEHATDPIKGLVLALLGRPEEALGLLRVEAERFVLARMQLFVRASMAAVAGDGISSRPLRCERWRLASGTPSRSSTSADCSCGPVTRAPGSTCWSAPSEAGSPARPC